MSHQSSDVSFCINGPTYKGELGSETWKVLTSVGPSLNLLVSLSLPGCGVTDLSVLSGAVALETLCVSRNVIADLSPLSALTSLRVLDIGYNRVRDLNPLNTCVALTELKAPYNFIASISDIQSLLSLKSLSSLSLSGNLVCEQQKDAFSQFVTQVFRSRPKLEINGEHVSAFFPGGSLAQSLARLALDSPEALLGQAVVATHGLQYDENVMFEDLSLADYLAANRVFRNFNV